MDWRHFWSLAPIVGVDISVSAETDVGAGIPNVLWPETQFRMSDSPVSGEHPENQSIILILMLRISTSTVGEFAWN